MKQALLRRQLCPGSAIVIARGVLLFVALAFIAACGEKSSEKKEVAVISGSLLSEPIESAPVEAPKDAAPQPGSIDTEPVSDPVVASAPSANSDAYGATGNPPLDASGPAVQSAALSTPIGAGPAPLAIGDPKLKKTLDDLSERKADKDGYVVMTFADLASYVYNYPELETVKSSPNATPIPEKKPEPKILTDSEGRIPAEVAALNGKKISVEGFMIPADVQKGKIKAFVLVRNQMGCCFGIMPMMNEWIHVTMSEGKNSEFYPDVPLLIKGTLEVGEQVEEGMVVSVYRMKGDEVIPLSDKASPLTSMGGL